MLLTYHFSDVRPHNIEVLAGADATLSCVISGITQQLNSVVWKKGGTDVTTLTEDNSYVVSAGTYSSNAQTTTLTVKAAVNTADSTYSCTVDSSEWEITNKETAVVLNVFGKKNYKDNTFNFQVIDHFQGFCLYRDSRQLIILDYLTHTPLQPIQNHFQRLTLSTERLSQQRINS